jgi:hypothetical protein
VAKRKINKYLTHVEPRLVEVEGWARDGLIDEQIAKNLGVAYSTFKVYKSKYPAFSDALKKGKEVVDMEVENALLKRALGYRYEEVTHEKGYDPVTGKNTLVITKVVTKEVHPETAAAIFWLKNRRPDKWRDKQEIEHNGNINNPMAGLSTEDLKKMIGSG